MMKNLNYLIWVFQVNSVKPDKDYHHNVVKSIKDYLKNLCKPLIGLSALCKERIGLTAPNCKDFFGRDYLYINNGPLQL